MIPITKEQYAIYMREKQKAAEAADRVNLVLSAILGAHGITEGQVVNVTESAITLADAPVQASE